LPADGDTKHRPQLAARPVFSGDQIDARRPCPCRCRRDGCVRSTCVRHNRKGQERLRAGQESGPEDFRLHADARGRWPAGRRAFVRPSHRGLGLLLKQDYDHAIVEFNEALRADPTNIRSLNSRGNAWRGKGELNNAVSDYNAAIKLDPTFSYPYNGRATAFYNKGELHRAIEDYSQVIRLDPTLAAPYNNRAMAYRDQGEFERALADVEEAMRRDPKSVAIRSARGEVYRMKGDLDRALAEQNEAVRMDPKSPLPFLRRGDTFRYRGELARALSDYDSALRVTQDYIPAYVGRGLTFEKQGNIARARTEYEKALNSRSQYRGDTAGESLETARARLAAFDSGVPQPTIKTAPTRVTSLTSIPTSDAAVPAATPASATQGRRVALIIGNSGYKNVTALPNPNHDADVMAASLRATGFESVTVANDATRETLIDALRTFANEAEKADWAVVYYSGHGMEVNGSNYLIPVEAKIASDRDVQFEAIPLDQVMASVEGAKKLKLVLLDACRNNPFAPQMRRTAPGETVAAASPTGGGIVGTRSVGRGLGEIKVSGATLVVYAAKHGQTALDGEGYNSPFAIAVVQRLATPNVELNKLFRLVRDDVMEATAGRQEPYTYGSLPGREDFFFVKK
jgi:tetratricopeptide (TPR) repeat protein